MGKLHSTETHRFIGMAVKELERDIRKRLGERIMEEYLDQCRADLMPRIMELVDDVNIKDFAIVNSLASFRSDLEIRVVVEDKRG
jgi:hypothetical protein